MNCERNVVGGIVLVVTTESGQNIDVGASKSNVYSESISDHIEGCEGIVNIITRFKLTDNNSVLKKKDLPDASSSTSKLTDRRVRTVGTVTS